MLKDLIGKIVTVAQLRNEEVRASHIRGELMEVNESMICLRVTRENCGVPEDYQSKNLRWFNTGAKNFISIDYSPPSTSRYR
ncbi:hypothetical protein IPH19_03000 [Candidatus Uhrbacteria bacterium]|nr:MAG: hypothetical protein IPH19_03000 [Candidatus Uhrbacteria bacterium]